MKWKALKHSFNTRNTESEFSSRSKPKLLPSSATRCMSCSVKHISFLFLERAPGSVGAFHHLKGHATDGHPAILFFFPPPALLKLSESLLFCIIWLQAEITASRVTHSKALNPHTVALHLRMIRAAKTGTRGCSLSRWKQAHGKQILVSGAFDPSHSAHPQQGTSSGFQSRHRPTCFQACTSHLNTLSAEWLLMSRTHPKINKILGWGSFIHLGRDEDYLFFLSHSLSQFFFKCNIYVVDLTSKERIIKPISWLHPEMTQGDAEHHSWELDALEMPRINCTTEKGNLPPNKFLHRISILPQNVTFQNSHWK